MKLIAYFAECSALCRVSKHGHSAKRQFAECRTRQIQHSAKAAFAECQTLGKEGPRQTSSLPSVRHSAKNNPRQNTSSDAGGPSVTLCRVLAVSTRQTCCLCRVLHVWHSAKRFLCRVPIPTLGKVFFFQIFSVAFIQYLEAHVPIWNFSLTFWYIFLNFYVYLIFSRKSKFELQVHEILEFSDSKNGIHVFECILRPCAGTFVKFRTSVSRNMTTNLLKKCFLII